MLPCTRGPQGEGQSYLCVCVCLPDVPWWYFSTWDFEPLPMLKSVCIMNGNSVTPLVNIVKTLPGDHVHVVNGKG